MKNYIDKMDGNAENILVTGGNGQLGTSLRKVAAESADNYIFTDVAELDITDKEAVGTFVAAKNISVIVNCAAYTNVDGAEEDKERADLLNNVAVANLACAAAAAGALLIHVSTDYVFDGEACVPYKEEDEAMPYSVYGITKRRGEEAVLRSGCRYMIFRTAWLYSEYGKNFVKTMRSLMSARKSLNVVFDQAGTPTYAADLAMAIYDVIERRKYEPGIYHYSNEGVCSWYDFAKEIAVSDDLYFMEKRLRSILDNSGAMVTKLPSWYFSLKEGLREAEKQFPASSLSLSGIGEKDPILTSIGALLKYIGDNIKTELPQLRTIEKVEDETYLFLNSAAVRNLELVSSLADGRKEGSLFNAINRTKTASGGRFLKDAILHPLQDKAKIEKRLDWVSFFFSDQNEMRRVRELLSAASDLERLASKASMKKLTPRDLLAIADTSVSFFSLVSERNEYLGMAEDFSSSFDTIISFASDTINAINRDCTNIQNEGTIILSGFDPELDEAREYQGKGEDILSSYMNRIKEETGIQNLKTGDNRIIGAYFEVSKGQIDKVPETFIRRQTLVNGERYTTKELEEIKAKLAESKDRAYQREREVFSEFLDRAERINREIEMMGTTHRWHIWRSNAAMCVRRLLKMAISISSMAVIPSLRHIQEEASIQQIHSPQRHRALPS